MLFSGAALLTASFVHHVAGLPFEMPRIWYVQPKLCFVLALTTFLFGCVLVKQTSFAPDPDAKSKSDVRFETVRLYTRSECPLCDDAKSLLSTFSQYLPEIEEVDIETDAALHDRFNTCIPVVEIDGKVRFRGKIDEMLLRRLIDAAPTPESPNTCD